jgi:uncharacterized Tic20 family protein
MNDTPAIDIDLPTTSAQASSTTVDGGVDGVIDDDERNLATTLHLVTIAAQVMTAGLLHVLVPTAALFFVRRRQPWLREHVTEQLNFQITYLLVSAVVAVVSAATFGIGALVALPVLFVFFCIDVVASVQAARAAHDGRSYRFPWSLRFLR